jgi:hypothetical protein
VLSLEVTDGALAGTWIEPELTGDVGTVGDCIPCRFESYVRILHPVRTRTGKPATWADVASETGRFVHPLVQWHRLVGAKGPGELEGSLWDGTEPHRGDFHPEALDRLCEILALHTRDPAHCFFGLWTGWTWFRVSAGRKEGDAHGGKSARARKSRKTQLEFSGEAMNQPLLKLPPAAGRDYLVLVGPLSAASQIRDPEGKCGLSPTSPNMIWPSDRAWFVASEIDFDSTLVGGSVKLIDSIVHDSAFEALQIAPTDSLTVNSDTIN